jgi:cyclopropane fatty-acyl-phospholipid synthase-like methyltransferase
MTTISANPPATDEETEGVTLDELPVLFAMEMTCGISGVILTPVWLVYYYIQGWSSFTVRTLASQFPVLGVSTLALLCFFLASTPVHRAGQTACLIDQRRKAARNYLVLCSALCLVGMTLLVWTSGGALSPFLTIYVMTHTLTLASVKHRSGPYIVGIAFGVGMVLAIGLAQWSPLADGKVIDVLLGGTFAWVSVGLGAVISVVVSTGSTVWNNDRRKVETRWKSIAAAPEYVGAPSVVTRADAKTAVVRFADHLMKHKKCCRIEIGPSDPPFRVVLGGTKPEDATATFQFESWRTLRGIHEDLRLSTFASYYLRGAVSIQGTFLDAARIVDTLHSRAPTLREFKLRSALHSFAFSIGAGDVFRDSLRHYGESPKFFELFLDQYMQYTCAYWPGAVTLDPPDTADAAKQELEQAQQAKLLLIAEWLDLKPQATLLDVGCGWGGLCSFMASTRQVDVWGVTNSTVQAQYARRALKKVHVDGDHIQCVDFHDYGEGPRFDAITVVGMMEHVAAPRRDAFFAKAFSLLKPGGALYLQCIMQSEKFSGGDGSRFLQKHVFPGYALETNEVVIGRATRAGFEVERSEEHHTHYGRTALLWLTRIISARKDVVQTAGVRTYRVMTAYLSIAALAYFDGRGSLRRILLRKKP